MGCYLLGTLYIIVHPVVLATTKVSYIRHFEHLGTWQSKFMYCVGVILIMKTSWLVPFHCISIKIDHQEQHELKQAHMFAHASTHMIKYVPIMLVNTKPPQLIYSKFHEFVLQTLVQLNSNLGIIKFCSLICNCCLKSKKKQLSKHVFFRGEEI